MEQYKGGCSCGSVRFELDARPLWVLACHCNACKKRTGSAYGISVMAERSSVRLQGEPKAFIRKGDSGKDVRYEFCPHCGTTIRWMVAAMPNLQGFAGGAFDNFQVLSPIAEMYTADAAQWALLGCGLTTPRSPDDEFRRKMAARQAQQKD